MGALAIPWSAMDAFIAEGSGIVPALEAAGELGLEAASIGPGALLGAAGIAGWYIGQQLQKHFGDGTLNFPPPSTPFQGGQRATRYSVVVAYQLNSTGSHTVTYGNVGGPVVGITAKAARPDEGFPVPTTRYGLSLEGGAFSTSAGDFADDDVVVAPTIVSITPLDGLPDTKNPPAAYPAGIPIDPAALVGNPFRPFPEPDTREATPEIAIPGAEPDTGKKPDTPPNEEDEPGVVILIPDLGTQIEFGPDGAKIRNYNPSPYPQPQPQGDPRIPPPKTATAECECPCDVSEVLKKIKEVKDEEDEIKQLVTPPEYDYSTSVLLTGGGGSADLPAGTYAVKVDVFGQEANAKGQEGNGGPNIWHQGWYAFGGQGIFGGDRKPLSYLHHWLPVPEFATSFCYTVYTGQNAQVTAFIRKKRST